MHRWFRVMFKTLPQPLHGLACFAYTQLETVVACPALLRQNNPTAAEKITPSSANEPSVLPVVPLRLFGPGSHRVQPGFSAIEGKWEELDLIELRSVTEYELTQNTAAQLGLVMYQSE